MKPKWILILLGIGALTFAGYSVVKGWIKRLKYGFDSSKLKIVHLGFDNVKIQMGIWIYNPSSFDIIVKNFRLNIYINDQYVATTFADTNYMIKSKVISEFPLILNLPTNDVLVVLKDNGYILDEENWKSKVKITLDGTVGAESGVVSVNDVKVNFDSQLNDWM